MIKQLHAVLSAANKVPNAEIKLKSSIAIGETHILVRVFGEYIGKNREHPMIPVIEINTEVGALSEDDILAKVKATLSDRLTLQAKHLEQEAEAKRLVYERLLLQIGAANSALQEITG